MHLCLPLGLLEGVDVRVVAQRHVAQPKRTGVATVLVLFESRGLGLRSWKKVISILRMNANFAISNSKS